MATLYDVMVPKLNMPDLVDSYQQGKQYARLALKDRLEAEERKKYQRLSELYKQHQDPDKLQEAARAEGLGYEVQPYVKQLGEYLKGKRERDYFKWRTPSPTMSANPEMGAMQVDEYNPADWWSNLRDEDFSSLDLEPAKAPAQKRGLPEYQNPIEGLKKSLDWRANVPVQPTDQRRLGGVVQSDPMDTLMRSTNEVMGQTGDGRMLEDLDIKGGRTPTQYRTIGGYNMPQPTIDEIMERSEMAGITPTTAYGDYRYKMDEMRRKAALRKDFKTIRNDKTIVRLQNDLQDPDKAIGAFNKLLALTQDFEELDEHNKWADNLKRSIPNYSAEYVAMRKEKNIQDQVEKYKKQALPMTNAVTSLMDINSALADLGFADGIWTNQKDRTGKDVPGFGVGESIFRRFQNTDEVNRLKTAIVSLRDAYKLENYGATFTSGEAKALKEFIDTDFIGNESQLLSALRKIAKTTKGNLSTAGVGDKAREAINTDNTLWAYEDVYVPEQYLDRKNLKKTGSGDESGSESVEIRLKQIASEKAELKKIIDAEGKP